MNKKQQLLNQFFEIVSENKQEKFRTISADRTRHITVVLENIFQPHNAAAVLRSCDCFGIQDVHVIENDNEYLPNKEIDMGSSKWLNIHRHNEGEDNTIACLTALKNQGFQLIATTPHENDCLIQELDITEPTALLFGTELTGLSKTALEMADGCAKIPMYGFTESYNISVSVALSLFAVTENMRKSDINWQLSEEEQLDLMIEWSKKVVKNPDHMEQIFRNQMETDQ